MTTMLLANTQGLEAMEDRGATRSPLENTSVVLVVGNLSLEETFARGLLRTLTSHHYSMASSRSGSQELDLGDDQGKRGAFGPPLLIIR